MINKLPIEIIIIIFNMVNDDDSYKYLKLVCKYFNNLIKYLHKLQLLKLKNKMSNIQTIELINILIDLNLYPYSKNLLTLTHLEITYMHCNIIFYNINKTITKLNSVINKN